MNLNSVILEGVVSGEPHLKETSTTSELNFTIEYTRYYKNKAGEDVTETSQFDVVAFGEYGKSLLYPLKKYTTVRFVGRLKQDKWEDSDGVTHSKVYIVAERIEFKLKKEGQEKSETSL